jgi:uncharacterized membrane protein (DUF4010 family)
LPIASPRCSLIQRVPDALVYRDLAVAFAAGALIGIERGWSQRDEAAGTRVAGVRTFILLGALGGMIGLVSRSYHPLLPVVLIAGVVVVLLVGHSRATHGSADVSATMVVTELLTLCFGMTAMSGYPAIAIAAAAITTLVLALRTELHGLLARLGTQDVKAIARFAIITAAILPFLPNAYFGPYAAWNPRQLWLVVVLVTGFSFAGYIANRLIGARYGILVTAIIGGAYSSTAVTTTLSQRLRHESQFLGILSAGIALASAVMFVRVFILTAVAASFAFLPLVRIMGPALLVAAVSGLALTRRSTLPAASNDETPANPIEILPALGFLVLVAVMALGARWAEAQFGDTGVATLLLITGALDVDAAVITLGGLKPGTLTPDMAGLVLAGTVFINMLVKLCIVAIYARWKQGKGAFLALTASTGMLGLVGAARIIWQ